MKPALLLDRDGVICQDPGYLHRIDDFVFFDGVFDVCREFQAHGYEVAIVTNQSGIARGLYSMEDFRKLTSWMLGEFRRAGVTIGGVFCCPHHPTEGGGALTIDCSCRKPKPGLIIEAGIQLQLDLASSILVGDKASDIAAGRRAGVGTNVLLLTGRGTAEAKRAHADIVLAGLCEVCRLL